jgi:hypothetical protein
VSWPDGKGRHIVTLDCHVVERLTARRGPGGNYSVIMRLANSGDKTSRLVILEG